MKNPFGVLVMTFVYATIMVTTAKLLDFRLEVVALASASLALAKGGSE